MAEQRLWAPWRLEYIASADELEGCVLCRAASAGDEEGLVVHRGEHCFVILNAFPYNNGHLMIAPYAHVASIEELGEPVLTDMMVLTKRSLAVLREEYGPEGFNIGLNQGKIAGAGVADHAHLHVVPRWGADTNFMPVVGDTRVLPQLLSDSWRALSPRFAE